MITIIIIVIIIIVVIIIITIITITTRNTRRVPIFAWSVHLESVNLRQGNSLLPKFNGSLLVPSSIFPENFIEIRP